MGLRFLQKALFVAVILCQFSICSAGERLNPNDPNRYLNAVREFADNVLKYGRDTYGPKHTPLFVDGLNIHTHEPVKWIAPNGDRWILSNLASQQNLFRTLDGLTRITGDPKYKQAAMEAIEYAFENLQTPNGLLHWGGHAAYDALGDKVAGRRIHEFKTQYPYYELMWQIDYDATKRFIEAFWAGHIRDWSNLDMDRHCYQMNETLEKPWKYEYKGGPVFFVPKQGMPASFLCTGSCLCHAATSLTKLSGDGEPLVWAKRLAHRYVETRDPNTGIGAHKYTGKQTKMPTLKEMKDHGFNVFGYDRCFPAFPTSGNADVRRCWYGYCTASPGIPFNVSVSPWLCSLLVGEMMGSNGKEFVKWAVEELNAWGKVAYRKSDNSWIPMLRDGISLKGLIIKEGGPFGPEGTVVEPVPVIPMDFWAYALAYRLTENDFMWQMARDIALGIGFGDIGTPSGDFAALNYNTDCVDPYAIIGFLELYKRTKRKAFLGLATQIGNNILYRRFYRGFFVPSSNHIYTRFDSPESLALLHLYAANLSCSVEVPIMWPTVAFFENAYRDKEPLDDTGLIYTLTNYSEPPISLQEAASVGDVDVVRSIIEKGVDIDAREDSFFKTALHRAAISDYKDVAELLIVKGADANARSSSCATPLHYAADKGHKDVAELLITKGADVNVKNDNGQTPLDIAISRNRKEIVELLTTKGAEVSSIYSAAYLGDVAKVKSFIEQGSYVNAKDRRGLTPLHYAAREGYKEIVEILLAHGAEVNIGANNKRTAAEFAMEGNHDEVIELLVSKGADISPLHMALYMEDQNKARVLIEKGADVNKRTPYGTTPLDRAVYAGFKDIAELLIAKGADVNAKDNWGWTPLHSAVYSSKDMVEMLIAKGADVAARTGNGRTPLWYAQYEGHTEIVELLCKHGAKE